MKKLTLISIGILNCLFAFGQTYSSVTSDKEIYDFLNWIISSKEKHSEEPLLSRKNIHNKIISWDSVNFVVKDTTNFTQHPSSYANRLLLYQKRAGTDTIFKQNDRDYIFRQFLAIKDTVWHEKFSKSKLISKKKPIRPNLYYYSIPLFSIDKNYVIIQQQYYCGNLCAYGGYFVYRRVSDKNWIFIAAINQWMS